MIGKNGKDVGGRPSKLTADVQRQIVQAIQVGNYVETAAAFAGISKSVFYKWMKQGRAAQAKGRLTAHARFVDAVEKALADGEVRDLAIIAQAAQGRSAILDAAGNVLQPAIPAQWQASAWRLERRMPDKWGRRARLDLGTPGDGPTRIIVDLGTGRPDEA